MYGGRSANPAGHYHQHHASSRRRGQGGEPPEDVARHTGSKYNIVGSSELFHDECVAYAWDCSDWASQPLQKITEVNGSEVHDSSSFHSNESNESRCHSAQMRLGALSEDVESSMNALDSGNEFLRITTGIFHSHLNISTPEAAQRHGRVWWRETAL